MLVVILLAAFPQILTLDILKSKVPLGTIVTWFGLIMYGLFWFDVLPGNQSSTVLNRIVDSKRIILILALFWGIISELLSGNWAFSFQNKPVQFLIWIGISIIILLAPVLVLAILGISKFSQRFSRNKR